LGEQYVTFDSLRAVVPLVYTSVRIHNLLSMDSQAGPALSSLFPGHINLP